MQTVFQFIDQQDLFFPQDARGENRRGSGHATAEHVQRNHFVQTYISVCDIAAYGYIRNSRIDYLQESDECLCLFLNDHVADHVTGVAGCCCHISAQNRLFVHRFIGLANWILSPVTTRIALENDHGFFCRGFTVALYRRTRGPAETAEED